MSPPLCTRSTGGLVVKAHWLWLWPMAVWLLQARNASVGSFLLTAIAQNVTSNASY